MTLLDLAECAEQAKETDLEPSIALSVLDEIAKLGGWADARARFHVNDIEPIILAMMQYADERVAEARVSIRAVEDEREACARIAEDEKVNAEETDADEDYAYNRACEDIAAAIRARSLNTTAPDRAVEDGRTERAARAIAASDWLAEVGDEEPMPVAFFDDMREIWERRARAALNPPVDG